MFGRNNELDLSKARWKITGFDGMKVTVTFKDDTFRISMDNGMEKRVQCYEIYTQNELDRRLAYLNQGKNPCGKWNDRSGKRICFENATPL